MKRKYADRPNWKRVITRRMIMDNLDSDEFKGIAVLIRIDKVREPLYVDLGNKKQCVVDAGYSWLTLFPVNQTYVVTAMFNQQHEIVQWYIDICGDVGFTDKGMPWYDDLYLDIVISPDNDVALIDEDDLELALKQNIITKKDYDFAYNEANKLLELIRKNEFDVLESSKHIFQALDKKMESQKQKKDGILI